MTPTTDVILMMRPWRAFIIARMTSFDSLYTDFRLVDMMSSHSSSFMRSSRLSRVMPALLTRIAMSPHCFCTAATAASTCAASLTFIAKPAPLTFSPAKYAPIACAPASVVAVPATTAPCLPNSSAIALPIPREAPVTNATCPFSITPPAEKIAPLAPVTQRRLSRNRSTRHRCAWSCLPGPCPDRIRRRR